MSRTLHGIVPLLVASLLAAGLALPAVAQMEQMDEDDTGIYEQDESDRTRAEDDDTYGTEGRFSYTYDYDTDEEWFESWYGESDDWLF
ncbi:MAG: hypothetical protein ACOC95_00340 [Planctomycetota bacterium]